MFAGFTLEEIDVGPVRLRVRHGGSGPPVVLLHGHPRTHATWHRVAPLLAERHTVICPDLRGYGGSSKPPSDAGHTVYAKRAMAADVVALLDTLGHEVINADPDAWYGGSPAQMGEEAYADYRRAIHDPATVHAMCEDYRAGLGPDRGADDADRAAGRRIGCPVLFVWSERDDMVDLYGDPAAIWREWADDVRAASVDSGHHMAEEAPAQLAAVLADFLAG